MTRLLRHLFRRWPRRHDFAPGEVQAEIDRRIAELQSSERPLSDEFLKKAVREHRDRYSLAHVLEKAPGEFWLVYDNPDDGTGSFPNLMKAREWFLRGGR